MMDCDIRFSLAFTVKNIEGAITTITYLPRENQ